MIFSSLFEASAVAVLSLHRFRLQCNCSDLALPLYVFVVAVLTTLPSLYYAMSLCFAVVFFRAVARKKLQPRRTHGPLYEISRMKSSNIISLIKKKKKIDSIW